MTVTLSVRTPATNAADTVGVIVPAVVDRSTGPVKLVTVLLFASCAVTLTLNAVPAVCVGMLPPAPASTLKWCSAPAVTLNVVLSPVRLAAVAPIVIDPAVWPVTDREAMPLAAVDAVSPVTVPPPMFVLAKVTDVVLSVVITLLFASRTSTVNVRAEPDCRSAAELVKVRWCGAPGVTLKALLSVAANDPSVA